MLLFAQVPNHFSGVDKDGVFLQPLLKNLFNNKQIAIARNRRIIVQGIF